MSVEAREFNEDNLLMITQRLKVTGNGWGWGEKTVLAQPVSLGLLSAWVPRTHRWAPPLGFPPMLLWEGEDVWKA